MKTEDERKAELEALDSIASDFPDGAYMQFMADNGVDPSELELLSDDNPTEED